MELWKVESLYVGGGDVNLGRHEYMTLRWGRFLPTFDIYPVLLKIRLNSFWIHILLCWRIQGKEDYDKELANHCRGGWWFQFFSLHSISSLLFWGTGNVYLKKQAGSLSLFLDLKGTLTMDTKTQWQNEIDKEKLSLRGAASRSDIRRDVSIKE